MAGCGIQEEKGKVKQKYQKHICQNYSKRGKKTTAYYCDMGALQMIKMRG